ncbi:alpha-amylase family glycosyl hydrolase [Mycoplasma sp. 4013]
MRHRWWIKKFLFLTSSAFIATAISCSQQNDDVSTVKRLKGWGNDEFVAENQKSLNNLSYQDEYQNAKFQAPFIAKAKSNVMYQLTVYSFADGNDDGIGDFIGLTNNLDYFVNLGIDTLYLSPIHPSSSYHGYDVIDYTAVAPELGGMQAFDNFITKAHKKGIRVVLDMVLNHTSYEHPWFQKALDGDKKYQKYYYFYDNKPTNDKDYGEDKDVRKIFKNINYHQNPKPDTNLRYAAKFWKGMPDLNLTNPDVLKEIEYIHKFWIKKGVDGFRYDAFYHYFGSENSHKPTDSDGSKTSQLFFDWRDVSDKEIKQAIENNVARSDKEVLMFGEWWKSVYDASKYLMYGRSNYKALGSVLDGNHYKYQIHPFINSDEEKNLINYLNSDEGMSYWLPFLDNHDIDRWIANYKKNVTKSPLGTSHRLNNKERAGYLAALFSLLSRGGTPILYDGNEILMQGGDKSKGDDKIREAYWWKDLHKRVYFKDERSGSDIIQTQDSKGEGYVESLVSDKNGSYVLVSKLIHLREQYPSLRDQDIKYIKKPSDIIKNASNYPNNLTLRDNHDGNYLLVVYSDNLGSFEINLKDGYKFDKDLINQSFQMSEKSLKSDSHIKVGVFLIKKQ